MKHIKKLLAFAIVAVMMFSLCGLGAYAATQEEALDPADEDNATITIMNPAKGETYNLIKIFDATVSEDGSAISYQGSIPEGLEDYFEYIHIGDEETGYDTDYIVLKDGVSETDLFEAIETWAADVEPIVSADSDGSDQLAFTGLPYGYYVVTTTHLDSASNPPKAIITVDSTMPNAEIYDKNTTEITVDSKEVDDQSFSIGDTITYTATFTTTNYYGSGKDSGKVYKYVIEDTLPEFLSDVAITSITIDGEEWADTPSAFTNKQIVIPWVDDNGDSLYANGAKIVVTYTAVLTDIVHVNAPNKNTISITPYDDSDEPYSDPFTNYAVVTTYAAALKKTDGTKALAGAKFKAMGLEVEKIDDGIYMVVSYDPEDTELGTEMVTDDDGMLYIVGLAEDVTLSVTETKAPDGYNILTTPASVPAQVLEIEVYAESGIRYFDADGNLVAEESSSTSSVEVEKNLEELDATGVEIVNEQGTVMPGTGGIGTTIFYVVGGILLVGAFIVLITKKRVSQKF